MTPVPALHIFCALYPNYTAFLQKVKHDFFTLRSLSRLRAFPGMAACRRSHGPAWGAVGTESLVCRDRKGKLPDVIFSFGSFYSCSFVLINGLFGDFKVFFQTALRPDVQRRMRLRQPRHWCCGNSALHTRTGKRRPGRSDYKKAYGKRTRGEWEAYYRITFMPHN